MREMEKVQIDPVIISGFLNIDLHVPGWVRNNNINEKHFRIAYGLVRLGDETNNLSAKKRTTAIYNLIIKNKEIFNKWINELENPPGASFNIES